MSDLHWVAGLRPPKPVDDVPAALARRILRRVDEEEPGEKTCEAENGLGFEPSCYWYVHRSDEDFGYVVLFWKAADDGWNEGDGAVCPFDTGGVWHEHITTTPAMTTGAQRKDFTSKHGRSLEGWMGTFEGWLETHCMNELDTYIDGDCPKPGIPEIDATNGPRAWTWEARVVRPASHKVEPVRLVIGEADYKTLHHSIIRWASGAEARTLATWLGRCVEVCKTGVTVYERAAELLRGGGSP